MPNDEFKRPKAEVLKRQLSRDDVNELLKEKEKYRYFYFDQYGQAHLTLPMVFGESISLANTCKGFESLQFALMSMLKSDEKPKNFVNKKSKNTYKRRSPIKQFISDLEYDIQLLERYNDKSFDALLLKKKYKLCQVNELHESLKTWLIKDGNVRNIRNAIDHELSNALPKGMAIMLALSSNVKVMSLQPTVLDRYPFFSRSEGVFRHLPTFSLTRAKMQRNDNYTDFNWYPEGHSRRKSSGRFSFGHYLCDALEEKLPSGDALVDFVKKGRTEQPLRQRLEKHLLKLLNAPELKVIDSSAINDIHKSVKAFIKKEHPQYVLGFDGDDEMNFLFLNYALIPVATITLDSKQCGSSEQAEHQQQIQRKTFVYYEKGKRKQHETEDQLRARDNKECEDVVKTLLNYYANHHYQQTFYLHDGFSNNEFHHHARVLGDTNIDISDEKVLRENLIHSVNVKIQFLIALCACHVRAHGELKESVNRVILDNKPYDLGIFIESVKVDCQKFANRCVEIYCANGNTISLLMDALSELLLQHQRFPTEARLLKSRQFQKKMEHEFTKEFKKIRDGQIFDEFALKTRKGAFSFAYGAISTTLTAVRWHEKHYLSHSSSRSNPTDTSSESILFIPTDLNESDPNKMMLIAKYHCCRGCYTLSTEKTHRLMGSIHQLWVLLLPVAVNRPDAIKIRQKLQLYCASAYMHIQGPLKDYFHKNIKHIRLKRIRNDITALISLLYSADNLYKSCNLNMLCQVIVDSGYLLDVFVCRQYHDHRYEPKEMLRMFINNYAHYYTNYFIQRKSFPEHITQLRHLADNLDNESAKKSLNKFMPAANKRPARTHRVFLDSKQVKIKSLKRHHANAEHLQHPPKRHCKYPGHKHA